MTTQVTFYALPSNDQASLLGFAAQLAIKVWRSGHQIYIHCDDEAMAASIKQALLATNPPSLMPISVGKETACTTIIGWSEEHAPTALADVMINLSSALFKGFSRFKRLLELTDSDESRRSAKRQNFRFYQERQYAIQTHKIGAHQIRPAKVSAQV